MWHFLQQHSTTVLMITYIVLSNAVNTMPSPDEAKSSTFYKWLFAFSHAVLLQGGRFFNKGVNQ